MVSLGLPGVSFGGVSRREGWSAKGRSTYQMGTDIHDGIRGDKHRNGHRVNHVQHWLILPEEVDSSVWTRETVWEAASIAEKRKDAREARFFDITWPRNLPTERIAKFVQNLYRPFVELGLPVQVDWETSLADDGLANDHIHGLIATRILSDTGFSEGKCREVDTWFRAGVRQHVAELFNAIATDCGVDVTFDPRPNVLRDDTLPPEIQLSRQTLRGSRTPGAQLLRDRRDGQRQVRRAHEQIVDEIVELERRAGELQYEIDVELESMSNLTSWQANQHANPLSLEISLTALMGAGIAVQDRVSVEGVGVVFKVGTAILVDIGTAILIDGELEGEALRALYCLTRCKGWRDLSLVDADGMPIPVPPEPERSWLRERLGAKRSRLDLMGRSGVVSAAREVVAILHEASPDDRRDILKRVADWSNPRLERLVAQLMPFAGRYQDESLSTEIVLDLIDMAMGEDSDLWRRHVLEKDLEAMVVPGNALSRPFRPDRNFYDIYAGSENAQLRVGRPDKEAAQ